MKNHANPSINSNTNTIFEYPINKWKSSQTATTNDFGDFIHSNLNSNDIDKTIDTTSTTIELNEKIDLGHRHFSSLHWLYPGTFIPSSKNIFNAAKETLTMKSYSGGGHTG